MLLTIGAFIMVVVVVIIRKMRAPTVNGGSLGWMSERWLAEHRASHLP